jgi:hypothetical protein
MKKWTIWKLWLDGPCRGTLTKTTVSYEPTLNGEFGVTGQRFKIIYRMECK